MVSVASHHAEWLSLLDVSGPFLSVPVLKDALPNGLDAHDPLVAGELRAALDEWSELDTGGPSDSAEAQRAFVRFVLADVLGFDPDVLAWDPSVTERFRATVQPEGVTVEPDAVVLDGDQAPLLVTVVAPGRRVDEPEPGGSATSLDRMVGLLRETDSRSGLVTDGERWTLVTVREGDNPGFATWWASLWREEKVTLQAFRTLLGQDRFLVAEPTLIELLDRSAEDQREVTTKLGNQTLDAVEILIRTIDQIDRDRGGDGAFRPGGVGDHR